MRRTGEEGARKTEPVKKARPGADVKTPQVERREARRADRKARPMPQGVETEVVRLSALRFPSIYA
jgi:hypothetical protein